MAPKFALLALMTSFLLLAASPAYSDGRGFRATLIRRADVAADITQAVRQSQRRLSMLAARLDVAAQAPLGMEDNHGFYADHDMEISIGTPPQKLKAVADTGSDLVWAKCGPCASCTPQGSPSYNPGDSSTFTKLPCSSPLCRDLPRAAAQCGAGGAECSYVYPYGLSNNPPHYAQGYLAAETFTLGGAAVPGVGFGCTTQSEGIVGTSSGIVGLGRGPVSLISQLNVSAFSYCLTGITSNSGESPLLFGSLANLTGAGVRSTPLLPVPSIYAVNLKNISIGATTTAGTGKDGIVFDSGTVLTFLADPAYTQAKEAVLAQTKLSRASDFVGFEACFHKDGGSVDSQSVPSMALHFDGADMVLPVENYFLDFGQLGLGFVCWAVQKSPSVSIIGNVMQTNHHVRYDVNNSVISFQAANCNTLANGNTTSDSRSIQEGKPFRVSLATAAAVVLLLLLH
ncbi:hypothetical protein ACP4OV_014941 [Aristida adscensionis]